MPTSRSLLFAVNVLLLLALSDPFQGFARTRRDTQLGAQQVGSLSNETEIHDWVFWSNRGPQVRLRVEGQGPVVPRVTLTGPNFALLWEDQPLTGRMVMSEWISLPRDGQYTISIRNLSGESGTYRLFSASTQQQGVPLRRGELSERGGNVRGWLASASHIDSYTLNLSAPAQLTLAAQGFEGLAPTVSLRTPDGREVLFLRPPPGSASVSPATVRLPSAGTYTVVIASDLGTSGIYNLVLTR
jgi:hypothetical protein